MVEVYLPAFSNYKNVAYNIVREVIIKLTYFLEYTILERLSSNKLNLHHWIQ